MSVEFPHEYNSIITNEIGLDIKLMKLIADGDVFIHGTHLQGNLASFYESIFQNGLKKQANRSILSTVSLIKEKNIAESICNYKIRGNARVIINIPEELENLFLGRCKRKFGDTGNQYTNNSVLDFLDLSSIPSEFIVGIIYDKTPLESKRENAKYQFIENPNFFNHPQFFDRNRKLLVEKLKQMLQKSDDILLQYLIFGDTKFFNPSSPDSIDTLKKYGMLEKYEYFIKQRLDFDKHIQESSGSIPQKEPFDIID